MEKNREQNLNTHKDKMLGGLFHNQKKNMIKMKTVLKIICLIALIMAGYCTFELLQYGKAIQEETRIRLQKQKDYFLGLEFEGVVVEKKYNVFVKKKHV